MYWRDIDTIAPRRPARVRRENRRRKPEPINRKVQFNEPNVADEQLVEEASAQNEAASANGHDWKEVAQRLQAEMDNFRKRQQQRADEAVSSERERLLSLFLPAIDNLTRALAHQDDQSEEGVRQGVELTRRELLRILEAEGVTMLEAIGQPFDPVWHEALATIPAEVESGTVVEQVEAGYRLGDKLLRPAKVVVAV